MVSDGLVEHLASGFLILPACQIRIIAAGLTVRSSACMK